VTVLLDWLQSEGAAPPYEFLGEFRDRLFDLAEPLPLDLTGPQQPRAAPPARAVTVAGRPPGNSTETISRSKLIDSLLHESPAELFRARLAAQVRSVRRPVWLVAGGVVIALVIALCLLPASSTSTRTPNRGPAAANALTQPIPTASATTPTQPVAALLQLLTARSACIRARSVDCLTAVDEAGSAAMQSDSAAIAHIEVGGQIPASLLISAQKPTLIERLGDSALIGLDGAAGVQSDPASALMIRTEAGWRIRSFQSGRSLQSSS
jgi:hypothetical protein